MALWPISFVLENPHHSPNTGALNSKIIFNFSFPFNCHGRYHNWSHTYSFLYSISFIISSPKVRSLSCHASLRSSTVYDLAVQSPTFSTSSTSYVALQVDHPLIQFYTYHSMFKIMVPFSHCIWLQLPGVHTQANRETLPSPRHPLHPAFVASPQCMLRSILKSGTSFLNPVPLEHCNLHSWSHSVPLRS